MIETSIEEFHMGELMKEMRRVGVGDTRYAELRAELERRLMERQLDVCNEQIRSAWLQTAAVILMFLTVVATIAAPVVANLLH
jgi:hypothetical protein